MTETSTAPIPDFPGFVAWMLATEGATRNPCRDHCQDKDSEHVHLRHRDGHDGIIWADGRVSEYDLTQPARRRVEPDGVVPVGPEHVAVLTPYDNIPIEVRRENWGWFGEPWWSFVCYDDDGRLIEEMRKPFPVGEKCLYCEEGFDEASGDSGQATPFLDTGSPGGIRHVHKECLFREVTGPLAHHERTCRCFGGESSETPGMTRRQEAIEVWRRLRAGVLFNS